MDMATPESSVSPEPAPAPTPPPAPRGRPWKLIAIIVVVIVALSGVAAYVVLSANQPPAPSVVTYATNSEMVTLDPSSEFSNSILLLPNVYETLTKWNPATNAADPLLATSWTHSSDGLTWNFTLRQGVTFHDGAPFNATALKFAIDRTVFMNQGAAYIWYPLMGAGAYFAVASSPEPWTTPEWANFTADAITIVDAYHVTFHLDYTAAMDKIASSGYGAYMFSPNTPPTVATGGNLTARFEAQQAWFNDQHHDSGSGPYTINSAQYTNSYVVLDRFANYWGGWQANQFEHAVIKVIPDQIQREQAVTSGAADITEDVPLQDIPSLSNNTAVKVLKTPSYRALYAFFNMVKSPTNNLSVRKALAYALPYDDMVTTVAKGLGTQSIGVIPATMWGHDDTLPKYTENLVTAQQWLSTSPHPNGGFTLTYTYVTGDLYEQKLAELWKANLATLNITLNIQPMPWESQWALATTNPATAQDIFVMYWWPTYVTPYDFLYNMFSSYSYAFFNLGYYNNATFDSTIDAASAEEATNPTAALADYRSSQVMLYNDLPGLGVVDLKNLYLLRSNLNGFTDNPAYPLVVFFYQLSH
jgi:peptide/nickel transport system substrate-binding protein